MNRFQRWINASHKIAKIEVFMIPNIQGLGQLDTKLITLENEFLAQFNLSRNENMVLEFSEHITISYLWVLGAYEIVRVIDEEIKSEKSKKIKHTFTRLRIPLAKYEPANFHKNTDSKIAYPMLNSDIGVAWQVSEDTIITRRDLSDILLDFLENFELDH